MRPRTTSNTAETAFVTGQAATISFDKLREARQLCWTCSSAKARAELGWTPRFDLARGMADAVRWFKDRGGI